MSKQPKPEYKEYFIVKHDRYTYNNNDISSVIGYRQTCVDHWFDDRTGRLYRLNMDDNTTNAFKFLCKLIVDRGRLEFMPDQHWEHTPHVTEEEKIIMKQQLESLHAKILAQMQSEYEKLVEEHKRCMDLIRQA